MIIFASKSNGDEVQVKLTGDKSKMIKFIEDYEGSDLGNDLICQDFVTDTEETGVVIFAKK